MSAPNKHGLDYFPHDVDMSHDQKIEYLEAECGLIGYAIYNKLLEKIYRIGYFTRWLQKDNKLFSKHNNIEVNVCINSINVCINEGLFNKNLYESYNILTSRSVQKRYIEANKRRQKIKYCKEFALLDIQELKKRHKKIVIVDINSINVNSYSINVNINRVNVLQSKVKESKVKENILAQSKNKKENHIDYAWFMMEWNKITECSSLSSLIDLSIDRRSKIKTRCTKNKKFKELFQRVLEKIPSVPFLNGENDRNWRVDFDFIVKNDSNALKILEGKYDNKKTKDDGWY